MTRHITIDDRGEIYEVTDMFDQFANRTFDPLLASTCVVRVDTVYIDQNVDDVPIYTVH